ncbi:MAG: NfeD family protein [Spirochaetales bacterium]|nr:NfeD family protein [Spirochaetales bacterium]
MEKIWLIWLIIGILLIIGEIFTPSFFMILIGISSLFAGIVAFFVPANLIFIPLCVFAVSTALLLIYLRPICLKYLYDKNALSSNVDAMKGKILTAETKIDGTNNGTVKLYADLWKARTEDESVIEAGEKVCIVRVEGNTVIVSKKSDSDL